jgi:hypothetical protein
MILDTRLPRIVERRIIQITKPEGVKQYLLTLPKDFASTLVDKNVRSLIVAFDYGLVAFPNEGKRSEAGLLEFLKAHSKLKRFFARHATCNPSCGSGSVRNSCPPDVKSFSRVERCD